MSDLQQYIDMPLDSEAGSRINKIFLPLGKRPAPRPAAVADSIDEAFAPKVTHAHLKAMAEKSRLDDLQKLLAYYATTTVPFERIATHLKMDLLDVDKAMKKRGRPA